MDTLNSATLFASARRVVIKVGSALLVDAASGHLRADWVAGLAADYNVIIGELNEYGAGLNEKPRITVLNKSDALSDEDTAEKLAELKAAGAKDVRVMSGVSRDGVVDVLRQMRKVIEAGQVVVEDEGPWTP